MYAPDARLLDRLLDPIRAPQARRFGPDEPVYAAAAEPERALALLRRHRLEALWMDAVGALGLRHHLPDELLELLEIAHAASLAGHVLQDAGLRRAAAALDAAEVPYAAFKGAHLSRLVYRQPGLRPAGDVDVLIAPAQRETALRALAEAGFEAQPKEETASHELTFQGHHIELDLHWHLFRPGRARTDLGAEALARRREVEGLWVTDDVYSLVILLLHPALTDHVTHRLIRAVDLDRWVRAQSCEWNELVGVIARAGLRTAAWAMLTWTRDWLDTPFPPDVEAALRPGRLRRRYLQAWIAADPAETYPRHPWAVRGAFSLALEDGVKDVFRAVRMLARARRGGGDPGAAVP